VTATPLLCAGDCNGDAEVTVEEIVLLTNVALGDLPLSRCPPGDADGDGAIAIDDLIRAVNNALSACAGPSSAHAKLLRFALLARESG
jgi:hypothetical protein